MHRPHPEAAVRSAVQAALAPHRYLIDIAALAGLGELLADAVQTHPALSGLAAVTAVCARPAAPLGSSTPDACADLHRSEAVIDALAWRFAARHGRKVDAGCFAGAGARAACRALTEFAEQRGEAPFEQRAWDRIYAAMCAVAPQKASSPAKIDALAHARSVACEKLAQLAPGGRLPWERVEQVLGQLATEVATAYVLALRPLVAGRPATAGRPVVFAGERPANDWPPPSRPGSSRAA